MKRFGEAEGTIAHAANAVADIKGWSSQATGMDDATGKLTFGDTPEAQATKAQYENYIAEKQSKLYLTAAKTIADNQGPTAAANWAQSQWGNMPDIAKVSMNQYLAPKMKNERIESAIGEADAQYDVDKHAEIMSHVPASPLAPGPQQTPGALATIRQSEGYTGKIGKDSNGYEVFNGINAKDFPTEFAQAKSILETKGKEAADAYADNFYQKNIIDKYNISSLPTATQSIVADGLVNHGAGDFGQSLIAAAKNGASPQEIIDMRRAEYQRLATANPTQYGSSLKGWNARLDNLQKNIQPGGQAAASTPSIYSNEEERLTAYKSTYLKNVTDSAARAGVEGYDLENTIRRAELRYDSKIRDAGQQLKSDQQTIRSAIGGSLTKGQPISTEDDLRAIPGMPPLLDKVQREQGDFYQTIPTIIAKVSNRTSTENSSNGYGAIMHVLRQSADPMNDSSATENYLHEHLARSDQTGITYKDYQDGLEGTKQDMLLKSVLADTMQNIEEHNGNLDGGGQMRALSFYHQVLDMRKKISDDPKALDDMANPESKNYIGNLAVSYMPSRDSMVNKSANKTRQEPAKSFDYDSIGKGQTYTAPDGTTRTKQ